MDLKQNSRLKGREFCFGLVKNYRMVTLVA
jgi:hypothetical protein